MKKEHKIFLDILRDSGITNMFGAVPYLVDEFAITKYEAREILQEWMKTYKE